MTPPLRAVLILATAQALQPERVFIGGLGYCGLRIAEKFHETYGCNVAGCVRSAEKQAALTKSYPWLETHVLDLDNSYEGLDADGRAWVEEVNTNGFLMGTRIPRGWDYTLDAMRLLGVGGGRVGGGRAGAALVAAAPDAAGGPRRERACPASTRHRRRRRRARPDAR